MSHYAKNPYEAPEPPRCFSCDEFKGEVKARFSTQVHWECLNPLCENSSENNTEIVELYSLRKILVMADGFLLAFEMGNIEEISDKDKQNLRKEIEKVKAL